MGCATANTAQPPIQLSDEPAQEITPTLEVPTSTFTPPPTETSIPPPTDTVEPTEVQPTEEVVAISVNPDDPYELNFSINQEEINIASDERLIEIAPSFNEGFDYTKLGIKEGEVTSITSLGEVIKVGNNKLIPYQNQEGNVIVGWDVEKGEMVHFYKSVYTDNQTGITINSYVYTDNEWAKDNKIWWELDELSEGDLSKAFFDYPLALNYMWGYYQKEFLVEGIDLDIENTIYTIDTFWLKMNNTTHQDLVELQRTAASRLRGEIDSRIMSGEETKLEIGRMGDLTITDKNINVLYKINYDSNYIIRSYSNPPFGDYGHTSAEQGGDNGVIININTDRAHKNNRMIHLVGSPIQHALFGVTAGGYSSSWYSPNTKEPRRSIGDLIMFQTCGEEVIGDYLSRLQGKFAERRSVPKVEWVNRNFPVCLVNERRSTGN